MQPKVTVGAVVRDDNGRVLITRRNVEPFKGKWCIPGGHLDFNERAEDGVRREVKEETGLDLRDVKFFMFSEEFLPERNWHAIALIFIAQAEGKITFNEEVSETVWISEKEFPKFEYAFNHKAILTKYFREAS
jgi:mutator protein MutT